MPAGEAFYHSDVSATHAMVAHLQAQLDNMACQNMRIQEQLATKDAELVSRGQQVQGLHQLAEWWEGQVCVCISACSTVAALWCCCNTMFLAHCV